MRVRARARARTGIGRKGAWYLGWPVAAMVASVRPWKELTAETITGRSMPCLVRACLRASLIDASFASAPELQKNTLSANERFTSSAASSPCSGM